MMHRYIRYQLTSGRGRRASQAPTARPRRRLSSRGVRATLVLAAIAGVLASQAIAPLAASAQTLRPHPARPAHISARPKTKAKPWSAAAAKPEPQPYPAINLAQARQQAIDAAGKTEKTAGYRVSPAVLAFLREGLGLRLQPSATFTGVKSGKDLTVSLSAPEVSLGLPAGSAQPRFSRTTMIIDPATGAVTLTSRASGGALRIAIPNARAAAISSGAGLSSDVTLRVPVLGQTADLSGAVSYPGRGAAAVELSGRLPGGVDLGHGAAELGKNATVTLSTAGGLRVCGPATLSLPGHDLSVRLTGTDVGKDGWRYGVSGGDGAPVTPLPGLALAPDVSGSLAVSRGIVRYRVHGRTARPWSPLPGVSVAGAVEFSNMIPNDRVVPAPGISGATPWAAVDGTVTLASGQVGAVAAPGEAAVNLTSGRGILTGGRAVAARLAAEPDTLVLDHAGFRGNLTVTGASVRGSVRGTGLVTLTSAGQRVSADSALTVTPAGRLVLGFPADRSVLGLGTPGHEDSIYWASAATVGFAAGAGPAVSESAAASGSSGTRLNLPGGLSATVPGGTAVFRPASTVGRTEGTDRSGPNMDKPGAAPADSGTGAGTYTLSNSVYSFLTGTLNIPLGSATLSGSLSGQTLTTGVSAPTALPSSLPGWIPEPSYASTQISVDEATDTLTLTAATGTSSGLGATLTVTIANASSSALTDGTDVTGSLALTGVPFAGGSTAQLTFSLGYTGGALSVSLAGQTTGQAASFANGMVKIPAGAALTLGTGTGLTLSGTADIYAASSITQVTVKGTLTDLNDWSLTVSDTNAPVWQPATGLTLTPDFTGTVSDTAGTAGFDLASMATPGQVNQWISPDSDSTVSICGFELSNQSPSGTALACGTSGTPQTACTTSEVSSGDLWLGIAGSYGYAPAGISLSAGGCFDLTAGSATISTAATGDLTSEFGSSLPFSVNQAGLTATVTTAGKFSLTGTATVEVTGGDVSGDPQFLNAGLSLSNSGIVAGVQVQLGQLGLSGTGTNGELYVSTAAVTNFNPATLGMTGTVIPALPAGLTVSFGYVIPSSVITALQKLIPTFPGAAVTAMASLSSAGFTINAGVVLGTGQTTGGFQLTPASSNFSMYLDSLNLGITLGDSSDVSLSGTGFVELPALAPGTTASSYSLTVGADFNVDEGSLTLNFKITDGNNALGIPNFNVQDFGGSIGVIPDNPSLQIYADNIELPCTWSKATGVQQGSLISFDASISLTQPALMISIQPPAPQPGQPQQPALEPLSVDPSLPSSEIQSLKVNDATFELAPFGGTDPGTGAALNPGVEVIFDASIAGVPAPLHFDATVDLTGPSVKASASIGNYWIGPVEVQNSSAYLDLSPTSGSFGVQGGISSDGFTFTAKFGFSVDTSALGATANLTVKAGLPNWLEASGSLTGDVQADGSSLTISASGYGLLTVGSATLGPVNFSVSLPGSLSWQDVANSITQIANFFVSAATQISEVWNILQSLGYSTWDILNALGSIGQYGPQIVNSLASAFGFSTTYYDIWTWTSSAEELVVEVGGGSQAPNAGVDDWYWNNGYNQDWQFVQSPWPGWYEIVNRGSGQCLSVSGGSTSWGQPLVQYPCFGGADQLWYMGSINLATTYSITSDLDYQVVDVQDAYPWAGGTIDQYPYNGGNNQHFWLTNSGN